MLTAEDTNTGSIFDPLALPLSLLPKPEPHFAERKGLFLEDLRGQLAKQLRPTVINDSLLTEEQLAQLYYSSVG